MPKKIKIRNFHIELKKLWHFKNVTLSGKDQFEAPTGFCTNSEYLFVLLASEFFKLIFHLELMTNEDMTFIKKELTRKLGLIEKSEEIPLDICEESLTTGWDDVNHATYFGNKRRININDVNKDHAKLFETGFKCLKTKYCIKFNDFKSDGSLDLYGLAISSDSEPVEFSTKENNTLCFHNFDKKH